MPSEEDIEVNKNKIEDWEDNNQKAIRNIMLRLAPQIQGNLMSKTMDRAGLLWAHLEKSYWKPGIITYLEFKVAMDIKISDNEDPLMAINKMTAHFTQCNMSGLEVPDHFQGMLITAKLPSAFNGLAQIFCQKEDVKSLDVVDICKTIGLTWEQRKGGKATSKNQAQKLSAVKHGPNEPPFKQQQGDGQRGG